MNWQKHINNSWQSMPVKRAFDTTLGKMLQPKPSNNGDLEVPYLKAVHVQWNGINFEELPKMWANTEEIQQLQLNKGDLLVCEGGEVGRAAILETELPENCIIQNSLHRVRDNHLGEVRFLKYWLKYFADKGWLDVLCNKATIAHFTVEKRLFWNSRGSH